MPSQFARDNARRFLLGTASAFLAASGIALALIVLDAAQGPFQERLSDSITVFVNWEIFVVCAFSPLVAIFAYGLWRNVSDLLPHTRTEAGRLHLRTGKRDREVALSECRWSSGRLWGMTLSNHYAILSAAPAILIRLPGGSVFTQYPITVAVGYTDEMRERWKAFLTLARVPRIR